MQNVIDRFKKFNFELLVYPFFALLAFLMCRQSTFSPFTISGMKVDDSVFYYIGKAMTNGQMPYRDIFDHKGPTLHIFNWIGASIAERPGIWIVDMILMFVVFLFAYKACKNFTSKFASITAVVALALLWVPSYRPGNRVEEYAMPFIFIGLYYFTCYFANGYKFKKYQLVVLGFTFICVFMLRPNMIAVWAVFVLIILVMEIWKKRFKNLFMYMGLFIVGMLIYLVPLLVWFYATGTLNDFMYQYFEFNVLYTGSTTGIDKLKAVVKYFFKFVKYGYVYIVIALFYFAFFAKFIYMKIKKMEVNYSKVIFVFGYAVYTVLSFAFMIMSLRGYSHYFMPFLACLIMPYAMAIDGVINFFTGSGMIKNKKLTRIFVSALVIFSLYGLYLQYDTVVKEMRTKNADYERLIAVTDAIREYSNPDDRISIYGNSTRYYTWSDRYSFSKYIYQTPIGMIDDNVAKEYIAEFKANPPVVFVIAGRGEYNKAIDSKIVKFIEEFKAEHYTLVKTVKTTEIYQLNSVMNK